MTIVETLLPEFDREMATTRRLLERVPDDKLTWQPHPKSMTLGALAEHLGQLAVWGQMTIGAAERGSREDEPPARTTSRWRRARRCWRTSTARSPRAAPRSSAAPTPS